MEFSPSKKSGRSSSDLTYCSRARSRWFMFSYEMPALLMSCDGGAVPHAEIHEGLGEVGTEADGQLVVLGRPRVVAQPGTSEWVM